MLQVLCREKWLLLLDVAQWVCTVSSSGPKTEKACTSPFPREWYRAGSCWYMCASDWLCCKFCVAENGCCCWTSRSCFCTVSSSGPKTEKACTSPFPREWYRAGSCWYMCASGWPVVSPSWCSGRCAVAWVATSWVASLGGGLCLSLMQIGRVSLSPAREPVAAPFSWRRSACLRLGILNCAAVCAFAGFCDAFGVEADGCSPARCCTASLCSISCWC